MKTTFFFIAIGIHVCSCNSYKAVTSDGSSQVELCCDLKEFITDHWLKHKDKLLYKHKRMENEDFEQKMNTIYKKCFFNLSINEIKQLFGEPNEEIPNELLVYYMSDGCANRKETCRLLSIGFNPNSKTPLYIAHQ